VRFKIGDFSKLSRVSEKTLRYYDEIGLLKPVSIHRSNRYRYYSVEQLPRLNRIIALKSAGFPLEEVAILMDENLPMEKVKSTLKGRLAEIRQKLNEDLDQLLRMQALIEDMEPMNTIPASKVNIQKIDAMLVASIRDFVPAYSDIWQLYDEILVYLKRNGIPPAGPPMAIYYDKEYKENNIDVETAVPIIREPERIYRICISKLPEVELMACVVHRGDYSKIGQAYSALMAWIEQNGYRITGNEREIYLKRPENTVDPLLFVTELQFPVKRVYHQQKRDN
jgi:effector-binding domain-containing protein